MSSQENLLDSLYALREDAFTQDILMPIFKALGYTYVSFNGGPYEFGVDLVAAKKDDLFGKYELTVIQSKKLNSDKGTKEKVDINNLLLQLSQCKHRELEIPEAGRKRPDKVILATPGQLNSRLREEIQQVAQGHGVDILEGPQIIKLLMSHCPHLIKNLNGIECIITDNTRAEQGNAALKKALFINKTQALSDYACDLEFFFGSRKENSLLLSNLDFLVRDLTFTEGTFENFKSFNDCMEKKLGFSLAEQNLSAYYKAYLNQQQLYLSPENQDLMKDLKKSQQELAELIEDIFDASNDAYYSKRIDSETRDEIQSILNRSDFANANNLWSVEIDELLRKSSSKNLPPKLSTLIAKKFNEVASTEHKTVSKPEIKIAISKEIIEERVTYPISQYKSALESVNEGGTDDFKVRELLVQAKKVGLIQKVLFGQGSPFTQVAENRRLAEREGTISISPSVVIDSGENIAIFGGAGFGKTTLLQLYASKCETLQAKKCILIELAENVNILKKHLKKDFSDEELAEGLLKAILEYKGVISSVENIKILKTFLNDRAPLLLDGLDEVYSEVPVLIKSIKAFSSVYSRFQIVVTSRPNMSYLDEIEFIGISLLPFTKEQLYQFFRSWCSDRKIADKLIKKVESSSSLQSTVTNPLLATIVCHLAESGINIPQSESKIYEERIKLLTGTYDQAKGISRQQNLPDNLMLVAEKLAFLFHVHSTRQLGFQQALAGLVKELNHYLNTKTLQSCLEELIEPCDILQFNTATEELTFGHFRFQESLVAQHLRRLNHYQFMEYLGLDFWKGAFGLFAEQNDINAFFDIFARSEDMFKPTYYSTLEAMIDINTTDREKRQGMKQLLQMTAMAVETIGFNDNIDYDY
ncbi:hypothetical protein CTT31_11510 [Pseudoalteromonas maricaloris]|uniref:NACHT domain-containing protein n=1 Tax=Pseudoalteromonas maricaloris TaxID=184924 RepID=UPI0021AE0ACA|nr:hypothetical protein [Pseudoalteromonas flavipulchra]USE69715.1 hypothetical protein CTT31_11510 [Pseudoalteromonas flavipulchra]